jgi:hypothetical protein
MIHDHWKGHLQDRPEPRGSWLAPHVQSSGAGAEQTSFTPAEAGDD